MAASRSVILACLAALVLVPGKALPDDAQWRFSDVGKVVSVSDIHGAYDALVATLRAAKLVDEQLAWTGERAHFVIVGDILDRGPKSRQVMDLVMRLEKEAHLAGGQVHVLLGNHEVMNLIGDNRYVADAEYAAFADEELASEREQWYRNFSQRSADDGSVLDPHALFNARAPKGFFGHRRAFSVTGKYGKWLLQKPFMVVINDTAYVHGGLPPYVREHGLEGINTALKNDLVDFMSARAELERAGLLSPVDLFHDVPELVAEQLYSRHLDNDLATSAMSAIRLKQSPLHSSFGPLWYRGSATCSELAEGDDLSAALDALHAERVVIGHTTTRSRQVQSRFDERVIEINTGMLATHYGGSGFAAVLNGDVLSVVGEHDAPATQPVLPSRWVGERTVRLDDDRLANLMRSGDVAARFDGEGQLWVSVASGDDSISAIFRPTSKEGFSPDLAAYIVDRLLGLDMVPVVVRRTLDGRTGTLQHVSPHTSSESDRVASSEPNGGPCPIAGQQEAMQVFDALINNQGRSAESMRYDDDDWKLLLTAHAGAFSRASSDSLKALRELPPIGDEWRATLLELDEDELREALTGVIAGSSIAALLERRNALISIR